jgi:hypothetical protein
MEHKIKQIKNQLLKRKTNGIEEEIQLMQLQGRILYLHEKLQTDESDDILFTRLKNCRENEFKSNQVQQKKRNDKRKLSVLRFRKQLVEAEFHTAVFPKFAQLVNTKYHEDYMNLFTKILQLEFYKV